MIQLLKGPSTEAAFPSGTFGHMWSQHMFINRLRCMAGGGVALRGGLKVGGGTVCGGGVVRSSKHETHIRVPDMGQI